MRAKIQSQRGLFRQGGFLLLVLIGVALLAASRLPGNAWATPDQNGSPQATIPEVEAITGIVYEDLNLDGGLDPGEPGIPNTLITLIGATKALTTTTDIGGGYSFVELTVGETYTVTETQPQGYLATTPTTVIVTLPETGALVHFGNRRLYNLFLPVVSKAYSAQ